MACYAIGDVQGCYDALQRLLTLIAFDPTHDRLWLTGDLVNRGPKSLEVLRYVKSLGQAAHTVLGNHDLHLLAVYYDVAPITPADTFQAILTAHDSASLLQWLQQQPLMTIDTDFHAILVHAGIWPGWTMQQAYILSQLFQQQLQNNPSKTLSVCYGDEPKCWSDDLTDDQRLRFIGNAFTRMRMLDKADCGLALRYKGDVAHAEDSLIPWFKMTNTSLTDWRVLFGHWAALNGDNLSESQYIPLDTGCVWGNRLTAYRLEDGALFSVEGHS